MSTKQKQGKKIKFTSKKPITSKKGRKAKPNGTLSNVMTPLQFQRDARHQKPGTSVLQLVNQIRAETIVCNLSAQSLFGVMMTYVTLALQKGFTASSATGSFPFYAAQYGFQVMQAYATGSDPKITQMPYWMLCLCHSLAPSNVPFQQGGIAYSWAEVGSSPADSQILVGYTPYGIVWNANTPASGFVDGFPLSADVDLSGYTPDLGAAAFSELIQYMVTQAATDDQRKVSRIVTTSQITGYETNVSAFSVNSSPEGLGFANIGGYAEQIQLEVPIFNPLFGVFAQFNEIDQSDRFYKLTTAFSGDSLFLGGTMSNLCTEEQWSMKRYPKFHSVDFLEFADVLAQWVASVQQAIINDAVVQLALTDSTFPLLSIQCPLTIQEMQLLLRNVIMSAFKDTQASVQSLLPRRPKSRTDNEFVPYVAGATTCPLNVGSMQLPLLLIENIRSLVARVTNMSKKSNPSASNVQWWVPVLGQYFTDSLSSTDYTYTFSEVEPVPSFASSALVRIRRDSKTKGEVREALAEVPISLIDGSTTSMSGTVYAYINDPGRLKELETVWNTWVATQNISSFSSPLGTLGTEPGISILTSVAMTRHWVPITVDVHGKRRTTSMLQEGYVDTRMEKMKRFSNTIFAARQAVADSSQSVILSAPYEGILNSWILPVNKALAPPDLELDDSTAFPRWQSIMDEPFAATFSAGSTGEEFSTMHAVYAAKMTRNRDAPPSDTDQLLATLASQGRGGILSGLAAAFIGSAFPSVAGIANSVAGMLPV